MLYTKEQIEMMLDIKKLTSLDNEEIISQMIPINLPEEDDEGMDAAYDNTSSHDEYDGFVKGVEWANQVITDRAERAMLYYENPFLPENNNFLKTKKQ
jgi:hypothetical protein